MVGSAHHPNGHHYAIDAAKLVEKCRSLLHSILDVMESSSSAGAFQRRSFQLATLADALKCVDRLIHTHLLDLLDREMEFLSSINENNAQKKARLHQFFGEHTEFPTLMDTVKTLRSAELLAREYRQKENDDRIDLDSPMGFGGNMRADGVESMHRRLHSTSPAVLSGRDALFSVEHPTEEEEQYSHSWYFGGNLRSSPSPPPMQTAGDSSPPKSLSPPPSPQRHRRTLVTGGIGVPTLSSPSSPTKHSRSNHYCPSRSAKDSSLFRLIVTLQLCLVRIEEANSIHCKGRARDAERCTARPRSRSFLSRTSSSTSFDLRDCSSNSCEDGISAHTSERTKQPVSRKRSNILVGGIVVGTVGAFFLTSRSKRELTHDEQLQALRVAGKATLGVASALFVRKRWRILCMNARVANTADAIEDWIFTWICLGKDDASYGRLVAPKKSIFWYSVASIRFQLMKRGMDLLYASIGKAIEITRGQEAKEIPETTKTSSGLWTYVVASLAASYYSVIGPAAKSASSLANAPSTVIQNAWGMVSLPVVKKASLEATRILKGAAIADRIEICGVSCFVLSQKPFPALASALRRFQRQHEREDARLCTIHENLTTSPSSVNVKGFQKKNIILHLTGGGFFAHTIASDLPYLLDWSATSEAVVLVPEYALFPHKFPDAINEVAKLYLALRRGQAAPILGFQSNRIVVSGESVGGNLAAALCVSMISEYTDGHFAALSPSETSEMVTDRDVLEIGAKGKKHAQTALPDGLMLCCPALNLALDPTPSRIDGANDPVLPSALIKTISHSYLGDCPATNPVASPYFASGQVLGNFPRTMIFTSSEDPFLDDSVAYNGRLRSAGVKSALNAVHDLPHAYWGLATAGIPEASQVQKQCQQWLAKVFK